MFTNKESNKKYQLLKALFEEMFQMNNAELDFGIYRIMNQKRKEINDFLSNDLFYAIRDEFIQYSTGEQAELEKELLEARKKASEVVAPHEIDNTTLVTKVLNKIEALKNRPNPEILEDDLYGHLFNFFGNYYDTGDFISKRRYRENVYAIPYEGEEVKLYWANYDQYYIKTTQSFSNYTFHIEGDKAVVFEIREATTERDNNKTQNGKRVFMLDENDAYHIEGDTLRIFFNYVVLENESVNQSSENETPSDSVPKKPKAKTQDDINKEIANQILLSLTQEDLIPFIGLSSPSPTSNNKERTILEKNLTIYTAKNEFDYFIHKDLRQFLERELDFYIKTEMIYVDDFDTEDERSIQGVLSLVKVFKRIAKKIIAFLSQIEDFQKKMWLKKKFVISSEYCMTLHHINPHHYPAILENELQIAEWVKLGFVDSPSQVTEEFLHSHSSLVLDTAFFPQLKDELIANIDDIDDKVGGILINSENFQALNLLQNRYRNSIDCIHIDPPYNTKTSGFLYKNNYKRSSWLAFINARMELAKNFMNENGTFLCHIDENEYEGLYQVFDSQNFSYLSSVIWDKLNPMMGSDGVAIQHEYIIWASMVNRQFLSGSVNAKLLINKMKELNKKYNGITSELRKEYSDWIKTVQGLSGGERLYKYIEDDGRIYTSVGMSWPNANPAPKQFFVPLIHPITGNPCPVPERGWSRTPEKMQELIAKNEIIFGEDEKTQPRRKIYLTENTKKPISSVISNGRKGKSDMKKLGLDFSYSHPISLYETIITGAITHSNSFVLDYFAGSGTTAHAIINMNRRDKEEGKRKYILIEMGTYFDTVLKPRIQKVIYSDTWKVGKPQNITSGVSHIFKYMCLESYEDTMNNLDDGKKPYQSKLFDEILPNGDKNPIAKLRQTYLLSYMLDMETRDSKSLLGLGALNNPFALELKIIGNDNQQTPQIVDLVETFNYLLGLHVKRITTDNGMKIVIGRLRAGDKVLIIWRIVGKHSDNDLKRIFDKDQYSADKFDVVYVNGDNTLNISHMRLIDEIFLELMFANKVD